MSQSMTDSKAREREREGDSKGARVRERKIE